MKEKRKRRGSREAQRGRAVGVERSDYSQDGDGRGSKRRVDEDQEEEEGASWRTVHWQAPNILYMNTQSIVKKVDELAVHPIQRNWTGFL
jgi:hypothetical protein